MSQTELQRDALLLLPDEDLLRQCRTERCRGTGPGGQSRNKTESAVTVTHLASGIAGASDATRSQHSNRLLALRHLRLQLALHWREPEPAPWPYPWCPGERDPLFPLWVARVLDVLGKTAYRVSDAAAFFGQSTGRFTRDLACNKHLWQEVNAGRRRCQLPLLRAN